MLIVRDKSPIPREFLGSVVALGNFDGLHLGHQSVISAALGIARQSGKPVSVLTFEPNPRRVFRPDLPILRIVPFSEKARLLKNMSVRFMRVIHFTRSFGATTAEEFVDNILVGELKVSHVVTGDDFIFGHNRQGNVGFLQKQAAAKNFGYSICPQVTVGGERCSSTRIRGLLTNGQVEDVSTLMGRPYSITGIVRAGEKRGRQLGFPTANIRPGRLFVPVSGVYAVQVKLRGQLVKGVANLGIRPTFNEDSHLLLEVHMFDWDKEIYDEHIEVVFRKYIRPEKRFEGLEALKAQISEDCAAARNILM